MFFGRKKKGMEFSIGTITRCAGTKHYQVPITIGGVTRMLHTTVDELQAAAPGNLEEARDAVVGRIRSALLEANAATFGQSKAALEGKTFEV